MARKYGNRRTEHKFSEVPKATIQRSSFDRSHTHKTTFDEAGLLYPILIDEILPGDTFSVNMTAFARLSTPTFPIMDNLYVDFHYFYAPCRLLWTNWQKFMGEQEDPDDSIDFSIPQATHTGGGLEGELLDYMGIPVGRSNISVNALPFRMYTLTWDQWYRDENLQDSIKTPLGDGPDVINSYWRYPLRRGKRKDYFTGALPWPSKQEGVQIPLGDTADVISKEAGGDTGVPLFDVGNASSTAIGYNSADADFRARWTTDPVATDTTAKWDDPQLEVDLSSATAATINSLRQAFQLQKLFERDARGGTRYTEMLKAHFGVTSPDARLQRVEYLGGGTIPVAMTSVAMTGPATLASPPTGWEASQQRGSLSAFGTASGGGIGFTKSFVEHGYIMCLASVRADLTYQQGLHKLWSRETRYDFYFPALANLGEQAIMYQEIFFQDDTATSPANTDVFGYQERWAEYRFSPSRISGQFRSESSVPLHAWHLAQELDATVTLGSTFIEEHPPVDRIVQVSSAAGSPHVIFDSFFKMKCARPMPVYSVPGLIDHF